MRELFLFPPVFTYVLKEKVLDHGGFIVFIRTSHLYKDMDSIIEWFLTCEEIPQSHSHFMLLRPSHCHSNSMAVMLLFQFKSLPTVPLFLGVCSVVLLKDIVTEY